MKEATLIIRKAVVRSNVDLQAIAKLSYGVDASQPMAVALFRTLYESSPEQEHWRFKTTTRIGDDEQSTENVDEDRRSLKDDEWAFIATEHAVPSGKHVVHFVMEVASKPRGSDEPMVAVDSKRAGGALTITAS
jgi:hypothetical protein